MNEDSSQASDPQSEPSVFGNLPRTRPGARSPRRDAAAGGGSPARPTKPKRTKPSKGPSPELDAAKVLSESRKSTREQETPWGREPAPVDEDEGGGLEELAWAGVAAAAEAATLGVRLANRALESLRGGSEEP